MTQLAIPVDVSPAELGRKKSLGEALIFCAELAGLECKQVEAALKLDKAQFSRWRSGGEVVLWPKLRALQELCGNAAPLLWMAQDWGYDLSSLRLRESETERENRLLKEENAALRRVLLGVA